jgi:hypothetical protein
MIGPNLDRHGGSYAGAEILVEVTKIFCTDDVGEVHLDDRSGGFQLELSQLDSLLVGECHRCGGLVDHRRSVEVGTERQCRIEIAVVPPVARTWLEPRTTRDALDLGWSLAPICFDCRREETRDRFDLVLERWRQEGRIRR